VRYGSRARRSRRSLEQRTLMHTLMKQPLTTSRLLGGAFAFVLVVLASGCVTAQTTPPSLTAGTDADQPTSLSGLYLAGRHAQIERDTRAAADYLKEALNLSPAEPDLLRRAFAVLAADGRMDEAFPIAERLQTFDADAILTHYVLWLRDAKAGDWDSAEAQLSSAPVDGIRRFVEPVLTAWALAGRGQADNAVAALASLGDHNGAKALRDLASAQIMDLAGRTEEAITYYRAVTEGPSGLSIRLARMLGSALERTDKHDEARLLYDRYLTENPGSELLQPTIERFLTGGDPEILLTSPLDGASEALFSIASALRQQRAAETALVLVRMALYLKPDLDVAQVMTADMLESMDRLADANDVYRQVAPNSAFRRSADLRAADNLDRLGQTDESIMVLEQMAVNWPTDPTPFVNMGNILRRAERFAEAVSAYDRAFDRIPKVQPHHWSMLYARGIALERTGRWPEAEADFLQALEYEPDQPYILNYLGYSWVEKGLHLDKAKEMIRQAVALRPTDGYIVDSLGWVHYQLGEFESAAKELERAAALRPQDPVINDHLGDALWRVGRQTEARFQWKRALSLDPDPDVAEAIKEKLKHGLPPLTGVQPATLGGDG